MHRFPNNEALAKVWARLCCLPELPKRSTHICSSHFSRSQYRDYPIFKKLINGAKPSLLLPSTSTSSSTPQSLISFERQTVPVLSFGDNNTTLVLPTLSNRSKSDRVQNPSSYESFTAPLGASSSTETTFNLICPPSIGTLPSLSSISTQQCEETTEMGPKDLGASCQVIHVSPSILPTSASAERNGIAARETILPRERPEDSSSAPAPTDTVGEPGAAVTPKRSLSSRKRSFHCALFTSESAPKKEEASKGEKFWSEGPRSSEGGHDSSERETNANWKSV